MIARSGLGNSLYVFSSRQPTAATSVSGIWSSATHPAAGPPSAVTSVRDGFCGELRHTAGEAARRKRAS